MNQYTNLVSVVVIGVALAACSGGDGEVRKKKRAQHLVELATVKLESLSYAAGQTGSLRALHTVKLFNQEEGRIVSVAVREGDIVKKGQTLIKLDDRVLRAQLDKARATLKQAQQNAGRLDVLRDKQLVAEEAVMRARTELEVARAEVRLLETRLGYVQIHSPFDGQVAERRIETGDVAPKHTHLMTVVDPSTLVTDVPVSELVLPHLKVGDTAAVQIDALGDTRFSGKVLRIYPTIDPATRLGRIEVALSPVPNGARAGQFCRVEVASVRRQQLVIPFAALRRDKSGEFVYVYKDGKVGRQAVKSGLRLADRIEIIRGLEQETRVVARGFLGLSEGKAVVPVKQMDMAGDKKGGGQDKNKSPGSKLDKGKGDA